MRALVPGGPSHPDLTVPRSGRRRNRPITAAHAPCRRFRAGDLRSRRRGGLLVGVRRPLHRSRPRRSARIADVLIEQPVIRDSVAEGLGTALFGPCPREPRSRPRRSTPSPTGPSTTPGRTRRCGPPSSTPISASSGNTTGPSLSTSPPSPPPAATPWSRLAPTWPAPSPRRRRCRSTCRPGTCPSWDGFPSGHRS